MKVKLFFSKFLSFSLSLFVTISHRPSHPRLRVFILYFHEFNIFHPSSCTTHIHINIVRARATEDPVLGDGWPRVSLIPVNPINRARPYFTVFLCSTNLSHHILFASTYHHCHHFHSLSLTHTYAYTITTQISMEFFNLSNLVRAPRLSHIGFRDPSFWMAIIRICRRLCTNIHLYFLAIFTRSERLER